MNTDSARDDLAFMRSLVASGEDGQKAFGQLYFAGGLCYGVQMLLHGGQFLGLITGGPISLAIGLGPTVVFLAALAWVIGANRSPQAPTATNRAQAAVFAAAGLANFAFIAIIGSLAWREHSLKIWLIYPCVVIVLQGVAWLVAFQLRRRAWMGLVAAGWFATGIAMGLAIETISAFIIVAGLGFLVFMLIPGLYMMRQAGRGA